MPRKRLIVKREITLDPKYKSQLLAKFINCMMKKGKKSLSQAILYESFDIIKAKTQEDPSGFNFNHRLCIINSLLKYG